MVIYRLVLIAHNWHNTCNRRRQEQLPVVTLKTRPETWTRADEAAVMRIAVQTILELSIEQEQSGVVWPHPWDHYPFLLEGQQVWKRYQNLTSEQKHQLTQALDTIRSAQEQDDEIKWGQSTFFANIPTSE